ncbi:MAG TPA: rhomboid family intramembrane serine protease [Acidobacteriaceae bacterium]
MNAFRPNCAITLPETNAASSGTALTDTSHLSDLLPVEGELPSHAPASDGKEEQAPSLLAYPATYLLVGINLLVFVLMFRHNPAMQEWRAHVWHTSAGGFDFRAGLRFFWHILNVQFDPETIVRFGGSDSVFVLKGQWWRLLTSTFVHVTILHLVVNMWCLWNLGFFGEPLLGKPGLVAVYLLTGVSGMMLSLATSVFVGQPGIVAGASGAVFGVAGILIILLSNRKLPMEWKELRSLRRSVVLFAVLNLAVGIVPRLMAALPVAWLTRGHIDPSTLPAVDNTAHLGGFLSGLALGIPLFPRMMSGKASYRARQGLVFACGALLLCLFGYGLVMFNVPLN